MAQNQEIEINIYDFVDKIDDVFDPIYYFTTSGEAIAKTLYMQENLEDYLKQEPESEIYKKLYEQSENLMKHLLGLKKENVYLETEWRDHILYMIPKNPRNKPDASNSS